MKRAMPLMMMLWGLWGVSLAQVIYVDADATGSNDGTSWADAYVDLQAAIAAAPVGAELWVAEGVYKPTQDTARIVSFELKGGISLYGGFSGVESAREERDWEAHPTVLSGDIGVEGDSTDNSFTVVYIDAEGADTAIVLDGFVIRDGYADCAYCLRPQTLDTRGGYGGGIYLVGRSESEGRRPVIRNCIVEHNSAFSGGGIAILPGDRLFVPFGTERPSSPILKDCIFRYNTGGTLLLGWLGDEFELVWENLVFIGGGPGGLGYIITGYSQKDLIFRNCDFRWELDSTTTFPPFGVQYAFLIEDLSTTSSVQFIGCRFLSKPDVELPTFPWVPTLRISSAFNELKPTVFEDCLFEGYPVTHEDMGIIYYLNTDQADFGLELRNCIIRGNRIYRDGGSRNSLLSVNSNDNHIRVVNCLIYGNEAVGSGDEVSAVFGFRRGGLRVVNSVIADNEGMGLVLHQTDEPEDTVFVLNSILSGNDWGSEPVRFSGAGGRLWLSHSLLDESDCGELGATDRVICAGGMLYGEDPGFVDRTLGDYRLDSCSVALDAGSNAYVEGIGLTEDFEGSARIQGERVDMGAYERAAFVLTGEVAVVPDCGEGGRVELEVTGACFPLNVMWTDAGGNVGGGLEGLPAGLYRITVTDGLGRWDSVTVEVLSGGVLSAAVSVTAHDCAQGGGGAVSVEVEQGGGGYELNWSHGATGLALENLLPGLYQGTLTDANGCELRVEAEVEREGLLPAQLFSEPIRCAGSMDGRLEVVVQGGLAPVQVSWSTGDTTWVLDSLGPGTYGVVLEDAAGCTASTTITLDDRDSLEVVAMVEDASTAQSADGRIEVFGTTGGVLPHSLLWSTGDTTAVLEGLPPGVYVLTVTDALGCMRSFAFEVGFATSAGGVRSLPYGVRVSPNPVGRGGLFSVELEAPSWERWRWVLRSAAGQEIRLGTIRQGRRVRLQAPQVAGVYLLELWGDSGRGVWQVVVE